LAQSHEVLPEVLRSMAFSEDISRQQAGAKHSLWQTEMTCSLHVVYSNNVQPCWPRLRHLDSCGKICPPTASNPFHSLSKDRGASVALWDPESTWLKNEGLQPEQADLLQTVSEHLTWKMYENVHPDTTFAFCSMINDQVCSSLSAS